MAKQTKEVSKYATSYKRRSGGVDKRALRGLNRTLEQKEKRNETVNRRRTLYSTDDSLKDIEEDPEMEKEPPKKEVKPKTKAESRKEMLDRWRKEKELKKKVEAQKQKKPGFKVFHVANTLTEPQITQKLAPVKNTHVVASKVFGGTSTSKISRPDTKTMKVDAKPVKTTKIEPKPTPSEPTRRVTRSTAAKTTSVANVKSKVTEKPSVTETRRRHISGGTAKTKSISEKEGRSAVTTGRKSVPVTSRKPLETKPTRSTSVSAAKLTSELSRGTSRRSTRSTAAASKSEMAKDHIAKNKKTPYGVKSVNGTEKSNGENAPAVVVDLDNTPHVTRSRGEAAADTEKAGFSFPAASFQFKAPDNLTPFQLTPLSLGTAADFLYPNSAADAFSFSFSPSAKSRRCSTPKVPDLVKKGKVIHSPASSIIKEVDSTDSEAENEVNRRRSKIRSTNTEPTEPPKLEIVEQLSGDSDQETTKNAKERRKSRRSEEQVEQLTTPRNVHNLMFVTHLSENSKGSNMEVDQPTLSRRRSTRTSLSQSEDTWGANDYEQKQASTARRRSTRKSVSQTVDNIEGTRETSLLVTTPGRRRSTRRSVTLTTEDEKTATTNSSQETDSSESASVVTTDSNASHNKNRTPSRRRSTRRSISASVEQPSEANEETSADNTSEIPPVPSVIATEKTPSRKRRSTRRSLAIAGTPRLSDIPEPLTEVEHDEEPKEAKTSDSDSLEEKIMKIKKSVTIIDKPPLKQSPVSVCEQQSTPSMQSQPSSDACVFRTPASLPSSRKVLSARRKTTKGSNVASEFTHSASKQTPRSLNRCSLVLKTLSPEEGVEVLMKSPMIEMERKRKTPKTPGFEGRIEPINFDELDESLNSMESTGISSSQDSVPETLGPICMETEINGQDSIGNRTKESIAQDSGISSEPASANEVSVIKGSKEDTVGVEGEHDVPYFRNLVSTTVLRLNQLSEEWHEISRVNTQLSADVQDEIRMTTGQAQLLISKKGRFTQFSNLVDACEFQTGEQKTTCADLQGFWEMVNFQVEDVYTKFGKLQTLKENNWEEKKKDLKAQPKKKVIKRKPVVGKPSAPKTGAKSKFAEFRAKMKQQQQQQQQEKKEHVEETKVTEVETTKTFEGGFFQVNSPVKPVENNSPRRSVVPRLSRSSSKPSTPKRFSKSPSCASPLLLHVISRRSRSLGGSLISPLVSAENSLVVNTGSTTASPAMNVINQVTRPLTAAITPAQPISAVTSASIFTPDSLVVQTSQNQGSSSTPRNTNRNSVRRSKRLSSRLAATPIANIQDSPGGLLKYLIPSNTVNTDSETMEVDPKSPCDVEMPASMKRGLLSEFDNSSSQKSFGSPALRGSSMRISASEKRRSSLGRSRRSVHFNLSNAELLHETSHSTAPSTPYNRNSLVPRRRTHSGRRSSASEHKENLLFTPPTTSCSRVPISESPATKMSKLSFDVNSPMNSIFTPPSGSSKKGGVPEEPPVADLIDLGFSSQESLINHGAGHPTESTSLERSSRRISLL